MKKPPRIWRYEVTEVWGEMEGRLEVGAVILDRWKANRTWLLFNFTTAEHTGGWSARLLGEASPEQAEKVRAGWARAREERLQNAEA